MPVFSYNVQIGKKNIIESIMNSIYKKRDEVVKMLDDVTLIIPGMDMIENQELNQAAIAVKPFYSNISGEIRKTIEFFNSDTPSPISIEKIIISGSGACIKNIDKYIKNVHLSGGKPKN